MIKFKQIRRLFPVVYSSMRSDILQAGNDRFSHAQILM